MNQSKIFVFIVIMLNSFWANASVIAFDQSPEMLAGASGVFGNTYANSAQGQNFGEQVRFDSDTLVSGISIYTLTQFGSLGDDVIFRLFDANNNLLIQQNLQIDEIDSSGVGSFDSLHRVFASFSSQILFSANTTFLVGLSGDGFELGQSTFQGAIGGLFDSSSSQFSNTSFNIPTSVGDNALRLYSSQSVSAPSVFAILGLGLLGIAVRRKRAF